MSDDQIKKSFVKVKEDILNLQSQIHLLSQQIQELNRTLQQTDRPTDRQTPPEYTQTIPSNLPKNQTDRHIIPADRQITPSHQRREEAPNSQNFHVSIGNRGVPTDRQTDQQTDRQTQEVRLNQKETLPAKSPDDAISKIDKVSELLDSLDSIKKELRIKFKKLTNQEMLIFSTIYQLQDQGIDIDYSLLAEKTFLSESSIRDYIQKLIKKGIPVDKTKIDNKRILLKINQDLRKITSLSTLNQLRQI